MAPQKIQDPGSQKEMTSPDVEIAEIPPAVVQGKDHTILYPVPSSLSLDPNKIIWAETLEVVHLREKESVLFSEQEIDVLRKRKSVHPRNREALIPLWLESHESYVKEDWEAFVHTRRDGRKDWTYAHRKSGKKFRSWCTVDQFLRSNGTDMFKGRKLQMMKPDCPDDDQGAGAIKPTRERKADNTSGKKAIVNPNHRISTEVPPETKEVSKRRRRRQVCSQDDDQQRIEIGEPMLPTIELAKLTNQLRLLHDWYMERSHQNLLPYSIAVKFHDEHLHNGPGTFYIQLDLLYDLFNQDGLDISLMRCWTLLEIMQCRGKGLDVGFLDPQMVNMRILNDYPVATEEYLYNAFIKLQNKNYVLLAYNFGFHWVLLDIELRKSKIIVMDSQNHVQEEFKDLMEIMNKAFARFCKNRTIDRPSQTKFNLCLGFSCYKQGRGNNLCGFYVCTFMQKCTNTHVEDNDIKRLKLGKKHILHNEIHAIQEALAGFLNDQVIDCQGEFYDPENFDEEFWRKHQAAAIVSHDSPSTK